MGLVLGSVFLFILISPGIIFRYAYLQGTYAKQNFKISAIDEIFWALVPALFFQLTAVLLLERFFHVDVRIDYIYNIVIGSDNSIDFNVIRQSLSGFLLYTFSLIVLAGFIGFLVRYVIRKNRFDIRFPFLRLNNEWYYLFSGKILDSIDVPGESRDVKMIQV